MLTDWSLVLLIVHSSNTRIHRCDHRFAEITFRFWRSLDDRTILKFNLNSLIRSERSRDKTFPIIASCKPFLLVPRRFLIPSCELIFPNIYGFSLLGFSIISVIIKWILVIFRFSKKKIQVGKRLKIFSQESVNRDENLTESDPAS